MFICVLISLGYYSKIQTGWFKQQVCISQKIKALADLVSGESAPPALEASSLGLSTWQRTDRQHALMGSPLVRRLVPRTSPILTT